MKYTIAALLLFFMAINSQAQTLPGFDVSTQTASSVEESFTQGPWEVGEIAVDGNINVKPRVIRRVVQARKGKLYSKEDINTDIQAILGLGSFEMVSVDIDDIPGKPVRLKFSGITGSTSAVKITYIVTERLQIKKIMFEGRKKLSKSSILDAMSLETKDYLDETKLMEDTIKVVARYHKKGFIDADVKAETEIDHEANTCMIRLIIYEGKKARVADVSLIGANAFRVKKLVRKMKNKPKKIFARQDLAGDQAKLDAFYKNRGYQDFAVKRSTVIFSDDKSKVYITIWVEEGSRYRFGQTSFSGNTVYNDAELGKTLEYRRGKIYNQEKFDYTVMGVQEKYADKGYLRAVIKPEKTYNTATKELDVRFDITENTQVYVDHIDIEGNRATKTYVFKREVVLKEGDVFSASKIRKSQEKIMNLGFIDDVQLAINPTMDPDKVDIVFDIMEGKPGMLTAGAGFSSVDRLVGTLALSHLNLFGRAWRTSLSWQFGRRVNDYSISWTTPWIWGKPTSLGFDVFNTRRLRPFGGSSMAFQEKRLGGRIRVGPRFQDDKYRLNFSYAYERVSIDNVAPQFKGTLSEGTSVTSSISAEFVRDTRDNIWDPTRGSRNSIGIEITGGPLQGDLDYYKPNVRSSYNQKLFSIGNYPFVLSFANRFGFVDRFADTKSVPVFERYFLGGADTVRGYSPTGQIGPRFGGKIFNVFNMEFKFPLARERKRTIVQWGFFLDIGGAWNNFSDINLEFGTGTRNLKAGAGFGIRFTTPVFPIRLDWGYGFHHKTGVDRTEIYFTLGNLF